MKKFLILLLAGLTMTTAACGDFPETPTNTSSSEIASIAAASVTGEQRVDTNTTVGEVIANPAFEDFGRLLFPVDRTVTDDMTLEEISTSRVADDPLNCFQNFIFKIFLWNTMKAFSNIYKRQSSNDNSHSGKSLWLFVIFMVK